MIQITTSSVFWCSCKFLSGCVQKSNKKNNEPKKINNKSFQIWQCDAEKMSHCPLLVTNTLQRSVGRPMKNKDVSLSLTVLQDAQRLLIVFIFSNVRCEGCTAKQDGSRTRYELTLSDQPYEVLPSSNQRVVSLDSLALKKQSTSSTSTHLFFSL